MRIHSWNDYESGDEKLVFWVENGPGSEPYALNILTGTALKVEWGAKVPEEFVVKLPWGLAPQIKKALVQWLSEQDIRPAEESRAQGKLNATRYHLEDLREILKLHNPHGKEPPG